MSLQILSDVVQLEEWREIPGFDGYEVSSLGRVRSYRARGGRGSRRVSAPRLKSTRPGNGQVREIRRRYQSGEYQVDLAEAFDVCQSTISNVVRRAQWAHVEGDSIREAI